AIVLFVCLAHGMIHMSLSLPLVPPLPLPQQASVAHAHPLLAWPAWVRHCGAAPPAAELAWAARPGCNAGDVQRG
ncbi:hypothetical protein V8C86DRAFT_3003431, partial [Haematococcus lacustris]